MPVITHSNFLYSVLPVASLTNSYMLVAAHSDFSHNVLPITSLTNSHMPVVAHSDFLYSVLPIILFTNPHNVLPVAAYNKSMGGLVLSAKRLFGDWILDIGVILYIYYNINLFNKIAPTLIIII